MNQDDFRKEAFREVLSRYEGKFSRDKGRQAAIARELGITPCAVSLWRVTGIPKSRIPYFKLAFPDLAIWEKAH